MAKADKQTSAKKQANIRPVDVLFNKYAESHQDHTNKAIHWICVPLIVFSLLGLVWSIPFPCLTFLGRFCGYINWASFLIGFAIYYYLQLSPVLSYLMLIVTGLFSVCIVTLEKLHLENGWPHLSIVCLIIFVLAWIGQFIGHKIEGKKPSFLDDVKFLLIGPIWLLHFPLKKAGIRY
jgi:uncharacterized membrane protein YGL010W